MSNLSLNIIFCLSFTSKWCNITVLTILIQNASFIKVNRWSNHDILYNDTLHNSSKPSSENDNPDHMAPLAMISSYWFCLVFAYRIVACRIQAQDSLCAIYLVFSFVKYFTQEMYFRMKLSDCIFYW